MRDAEIFPLRGEAHHPWQLYAGVVLLDEHGRLPLLRESDGCLALPRQTLLTSENFVSAIHQLVLETANVIPTLTGYLGSVTSRYIRYDSSTIERTILYFEARFRSAYRGRYTDLPAFTPYDELTWVSLGEAFELLAQEPHGEETIIERAGVAHRVFAA